MTQLSPPGWRWERHAALPSTQDAALDAAQAGDPGRLVILAGLQTAGRGSRGRNWASPPGNLNLSILLRPGETRIEPGRWALLAAVSLYEALSPYTDGLMLKWPNDVLLHGAKLAGILIDSQPGEGGFLVIGLGANLATAPHVADRQTARLPPPAPPAAIVAEHVMTALEGWGALETPDLVEAWLARAHPIGTLLDVKTQRRQVRGAFVGLTAAGELRISGEAAAISSAEVFLA